MRNDLAGACEGRFNMASGATHEVDPARLAIGRWDDTQQKHLGEGDIYASYSADRIARVGKVRRPFTFRGQLWVCTSCCGAGGSVIATAYRLMPAQHCEGAAVTLAEKTADCAAARADPGGFYHGVIIRYRGEVWVLSGPPAEFMPGPPQAGLFSGLFDLPGNGPVVP